MFFPFKVTLATMSATAKLVLLQLRGRGDEGDDDTAEQADEAPFLQQLGLAARPVVQKTLRALGYQDGDEVVVLKVWDKARTPTDLAEGETRMYAAGKTTVRIRALASGGIEITADGGDVVINGGTQKVARTADPVILGTLAGTVGGTPVQFVFVPANASGAPGGIPAPAATVTLSGVVANAGGAANFKA